VTLLLFGAKRVPEVARKVGSTLAELRRASDDLRRQVVREIHSVDTTTAEPRPPRALDPAAPAAPPALTEPRGAPAGQAVPPPAGDGKHDEAAS
jgi:Sec-independent protein translocase protein TatA